MRPGFESPWGRHFLLGQKRIVRRCKRKKFQGFENSGRFYGRNFTSFVSLYPAAFPGFFYDLRTLRGFEVLSATGCKFSGDEGLSVFKTV